MSTTLSALLCLLVASPVQDEPAIKPAADSPIIQRVKKELGDDVGRFGLLVTWEAKDAENAKQLDAALAIAVKGTRTEPGNIVYEGFTAPTEPLKYWLVEHWESTDALEAHMKLDHTKAILDAFGKHAKPGSVSVVVIKQVVEGVKAPKKAAGR